MSAQRLTWNSTWTYSLAVCESSPWWPCSIAVLAVVVFIAPCVYSPVFPLNVVPAAECSSSDGWWWLEHAEGRVKSQHALFLSVPKNNQWNKVFLSVSGECYDYFLWFSLLIVVHCVLFVTSPFFPVLSRGQNVSHQLKASDSFSGTVMSSCRSREERAREWVRQQRDSGREEWTRLLMWAALSQWLRKEDFLKQIQIQITKN